MAKAYAYMASEQQVVHFARMRIREIRDEINAAEEEEKMWKFLIERMGLCDHCGGEKKIRVMVAQDETSMEPCDMCKGTGKKDQK